jgi:putative MATE family efflux protein
MTRSKKQKIIMEGPIIKALIAISAPIVLANVLHSAYHFTDAFWVGRLGGSAVATVAVSFPITFLLMTLSGGFAIAGATFASQFAGSKNWDMIGKIAGQSLLLMASTASLLSAVGYITAPAILHFIGVEEVIFTEALAYLRVSFISVLFMFSFQMYQSLTRGIGEVNMPLGIVFGTVLLNMLLDPLFIFGWGPIQGAGVAGAAYATILTQGIAAIIGLYLLFSGRSGIKIHMRNFIPDFSLLKKIFILASPASIEQGTRALGMNLMILLVSSFGTLSVAAYGVGSNILRFVFIPAMGFSMATSALVGQNIGGGNSKRADKIALVSVLLSFVLFTLMGGIIYLFSRQIVEFFVPNDPEVIASASLYIRLMALSFGFMAGQQVLSGVFRGAANTYAAMVLALVLQWIVQFPLAYVLSRHTTLGILGIWWAFPISFIITFIIALIWFYRGNWQKPFPSEEEKFLEKVSEEIISGEGLR